VGFIIHNHLGDEIDNALLNKTRINKVGYPRLLTFATGVGWKALFCHTTLRTEEKIHCPHMEARKNLLEIADLFKLSRNVIKARFSCP
jgi:hypothetical protein